MGSFPVAIPDIASRAEFVRSQLEVLRVSASVPACAKNYREFSVLLPMRILLYTRMTNHGNPEVTLFLSPFFPLSPPSPGNGKTRSFR